MINLLPPELKQNYGYARRNSSLLRVLTFFGAGMVGLAALVASGVVYLQQTANSYNEQASSTEAILKEQKQSEVEADVKEMSEKLKLAVDVLSQEVLFSQLLKRLAVITPAGVTLGGVNITELGGGIDVTATALDYNTATQLHVNLQDPDNKIFAKADIVNITCDGNTESDRPCVITVRALFAEDNQFLFINGEDSAGEDD